MSRRKSGGALMQRARRWENLKARQRRKVRAGWRTLGRFLEVALVLGASVVLLDATSGLLVMATFVALAFTVVGVVIGAIVWRR